MTGNALTMNPITGTNAYVNGAYGTSQPGFWGNVGSFGTTPAGFGIQAFQPQVPINQWNPFTPQSIQQPGFVAQTMSPLQTSFQTPQFGYQGIGSSLQTTSPVFNTILQTTPPQVLNTILQTTPPQVLPYILNALACQQTCQQVLAQNPQAVMGINPQSITQPFFGYGTTNQSPIGFGGTVGGFGGYGVNPFMAGQPAFQQQGACVGCQPGTQQWTPTVGFQGGFGQVVPQQPWLNAIYGTW